MKDNGFTFKAVHLIKEFLNCSHCCIHTARAYANEAGRIFYRNLNMNIFVKLLESGSIPPQKYNL